MGWGSTYDKASESASPEAKAEANETWSSIQAAGKAVARTANMVVQAPVELGVNTVVGGIAFIAFSLYGAVKRLFTDPPAPVRVCPLKQSVDISTNEYRKTLVNTSFDGENDSRLSQSMHALSQPMSISDEEAEPHLETIAELRKRPLEEIRADYQRYRALREEQEDKILHGRPKLDEIDQLKPDQADFMGSTWQLRYGKVAGDHLGVDPVFGAMLNPTGGLVGPGNWGVHPDSWYVPEAVGYHGAYHDAMGYLFNYQKAGPGYNYMRSPVGLPTDSPAAGQAIGAAQFAYNLM